MPPPPPTAVGGAVVSQPTGGGDALNDSSSAGEESLIYVSLYFSFSPYIWLPFNIAIFVRRGTCLNCICFATLPASSMVKHAVWFEPKAVVFFNQSFLCLSPVYVACRSRS